MGLDANVPCSCAVDGCPHPDGELASDRIANWHGVRRLRYLTTLVGADRFPTVLRLLPSTNDGGVRPAEVGELAAELGALRAALAELPGYRLREVDTDEVLAGPVADGESIRRSRNIVLTLGSAGLTVRDGRAGPILFQSSRFREDSADGGRILVSLNNSHSLRLYDLPICDHLPALLVVDDVPLRPPTASIDTLLALCAVAAANGSGIYWT